MSCSLFEDGLIHGRGPGGGASLADVAPNISPPAFLPPAAEAATRARVALMYLLIITANCASWLWAWTMFSDKPMLMSAAVLAYILGLRHAVDADHIAAIDNVVRRLVQQGDKPIATGFFFSLGHSTVVLFAVIIIAATATALQQEFGEYRAIGGFIGRSIAALLLLVIGCANLVVLTDLWRALRRSPEATHRMYDADMLGAPGGVLARICTPIFRTISNSWRMFPLGLLFGLSFDTATEVSLLGISAGQAGQDQSTGSILVFPALFASSMTLVDATDGVLMAEAYGWALINPVRKLWYNFTMTFASVVVAVFIASVQIVGLLVDKAGLDGGLWHLIAGLGDDLTTFGLVIIGIFVGTWAVSCALYRWRRFGSLAVDPA
jgi:nickel/cobalt transporter (NiCoT) family protein